MNLWAHDPDDPVYLEHLRSIHEDEADLEARAAAARTARGGKRSRDFYRNRWATKLKSEQARVRRERERGLNELIAALAPMVAKLPPEDYEWQTPRVEKFIPRRRPWDPMR